MSTSGGRLRDRLGAHLGGPRAPLVLLATVLCASIGARLFRLDQPGESKPGEGFVFDEKYYVNAARVIAGVAFPSGDTYHPGPTDPSSGVDPNAEHPQLGKLLIAAGIRLLGDGPVGWRLAAVVMGTLALLALYWLIRAAGGSRWLALGAVAIMAFENLELVHGRIGVLDVFCLPFLLGGVALWLRGRPLLSGLCIGLGCAMKLFAALGLLVIVVVELFGLAAWLWERRSPEGRRPRGLPAPLRPALRLALCAAAALATLLVVLAVLDHYVPAYHDGVRVSTGRPWDHLRFMYDYGRDLRSPDGPRGIASYPWQFWIDVEASNYYTTSVKQLVGGEVVAVDTPVVYAGLINPVLLALALPGLALCSVRAVRRRDTLATVVAAGYVATWVPWLLAWVFDRRTVYLYYMVMTVPFVSIAAAALLGTRRVPRVAVGIWIGAYATAFCVLYPFRTFPFT